MNGKVDKALYRLGDKGRNRIGLRNCRFFFIEFEELKEKSKKIIPERSEEIMTIAEKLREEGKREGKREGIEKIISKLLVSKFGEFPEKYRVKLKELDEENLELIAEKTLEIEELKELEQYIN